MMQFIYVCDVFWSLTVRKHLEIEIPSRLIFYQMFLPLYLSVVICLCYAVLYIVVLVRVKPFCYDVVLTGFNTDGAVW